MTHDMMTNGIINISVWTNCQSKEVVVYLLIGSFSVKVTVSAHTVSGMFHVC